MTMNYKYNSPNEWLEEALRDDRVTMDEVVTLLLSKISGDDIQDIFEKEMAEDGYFKGTPSISRGYYKVFAQRAIELGLKSDWWLVICEIAYQAFREMGADTLGDLLDLSDEYIEDVENNLEALMGDEEWTIP